MNKLQQLFKERRENLLTVYYTAGYPHLTDTEKIATGLEQAGVDIIEIGIPFSDPVADGPVIQASNQTALDNGMTLALLLDQVRSMRPKISIPIVLMGYLNPVLQFGIERFCQSAAAAGVDGVILPDMPLDVYRKEYKSLFDQHQLSVSLLVAPTTSEDRMTQIDQLTTGFIYAVSSSSTTGATAKFEAQHLEYFKRIQRHDFNHPVLFGFGISNHETFQVVNQYGAGAIVGSAFIRCIQQSNDWEHDIRDFIRGLKGQS